MTQMKSYIFLRLLPPSPRPVDALGEERPYADLRSISAAPGSLPILWSDDVRDDAGGTD